MTAEHSFNPRPTFPIPVSVFSRDLVKTFDRALEKAWALASARTPVPALPSERRRHVLASGIVLAATCGTRDENRLAQSGLDYLARIEEFCATGAE